MRIHFDWLIGELQHTVSVRGYNCTRQEYITGIELLPRDCRPDRALDPDTAYLCGYRDLRLYDPQFSFPPLICIVEPGVYVDEVLFQNRVVAAVSGCTVAETLVALNKLMYEYGTHTSALNDVTISLTRCRGLDELVEEGYRVLRNPIIVTDSNQKVAAFTDPRLISDEHYRVLTGLEYLPLGNPLVPQELFSDPAHTIIGSEGDIPANLVQPLTVRGKIIGYLHVTAFNHPLEQEDMFSIDLLANLLAVELWNLPQHHPVSREAETDRFLRDVLDNTAGDEAAMRQRQQELGLKLEKYLYAVTVLVRDPSPAPRQSFYQLAKDLSSLLPGSRGILYRNSAFLLLSFPEEPRDLPAYLAPLLPLFEHSNLAAGLSNSFLGLSDLQIAGFQTNKALQLGLRLDPGKRFYRYQDFSLDYMLELCLKDDRADNFFAPELARLADRCRDGDADLMDTLRTYLRCGRNKSQTARSMFLHISTIKYRMAQIQDILGLDLENDDNALRLLLSFKLLDYQKQFKGYKPFDPGFLDKRDSLKL